MIYTFAALVSAVWQNEEGRVPSPMSHSLYTPVNKQRSTSEKFSQVIIGN